MPLGTLVLVIWGLAQAFGHLHAAPARRLDDLALLAPAVALLVFVSSQVGYTQHSRYVIPILPYLMINAGRLAGNRRDSSRVRRWLVWACLASTAVSSLKIYPHSLSYFNEAAGGPLRGHDYLLDSNIDWGQDLLYLKMWLESHGEAHPLGLAYFNFYVDPALAGIKYDLPPPGPEVFPEKNAADLTECGPKPGYYAISVNLLRGCESPIADGQGGFRHAHPRQFEYFRNFQPVAQAGYSIYIYHITPEESEVVRKRIGLPRLK